MSAIQKLLPDEEYKYIADSKNCPYGEKSDQELKAIVATNTESLMDWGAKIIVIACNTATTRCISFLREKYPSIHFVGTEPAIKLAVATSAKSILVMATPGTITSERLQSLIEENQKPNQVIRLLSCPGLADLIEQNYSSHNLRPIIEYLKTLFQKTEDAPEIIVLGCTHYSLIKPEIQSFFPSARLIDGNDGVARQVQELIQK